MPIKDSSTWEDDDGISLHLASNPFSNREKKISIHETSVSVRQMVLSLALVPSIPKIYHWKHLNFIIITLKATKYYFWYKLTWKNIRKSSKILKFDLFAIVFELLVLLYVAYRIDYII